MTRRSMILGSFLLGAVAHMASAFAQEQTAAELAQAIESTKIAAAPGPGYDAAFRRDPMRPLVDHEGNMLTSMGFQGGLAVQGIIWSDERPLVVVDDELLAEGSLVGPYTIVDIQPDGVTVSQGEAASFIPLDRGLPLSSAELPVQPAPAVAPGFALDPIPQEASPSEASPQESPKQE